jgi:hypothetical protein
MAGPFRTGRTHQRVEPASLLLGDRSRGFRRGDTAGDGRLDHRLRMDQRAALILLISTLVAVAAGFLTAWAHQPAAEAVLAGGAAFGATLALLHQLIG